MSNDANTTRKTMIPNMKELSQSQEKLDSNDDAEFDFISKNEKKTDECEEGLLQQHGMITKK